jgi:dihydrofolate synthase/folylpolyglutamate synthase
MDRLGPSLVDIAREKAGIAKPGMEIVLGPIDPVPLAAIEEVARANGARTIRAADVPEAARFAKSARIGLAGAHQKDNAAVAYMLGERIGASAEARARGVAAARWAGRLETIHRDGGAFLLDAAHNPDGIVALAGYLKSLAQPPANTALVFGALADKDWPAMLSGLAPSASHRFYVRPQGRVATPPEELAQVAPGEPQETLARALARARASVGPAGLVVVAGSIFLVGEARALLLELPRDPAVAL